MIFCLDTNTLVQALAEGHPFEVMIAVVIGLVHALYSVL